MPGTRITPEDQKNIKEDLFCFHCGFLLKDPVQTRCGHLACSSCVKTLLRSSNPTCPKDGTKLNKEEIFPDGYTKRQLQQIHLHCLNSQCKWHGLNKNLEDHINNGCPYVPEEPSLDSDTESQEIESSNGNEQDNNHGNENMEVAPHNVPRNNTGLICYIQLLLNFLMDIAARICAIRPAAIMQVFTILPLQRQVEPIENEIQELKNTVKEVEKELARVRQRNEILERELREKASAIDRLDKRWDQVEEALALNAARITDLESVRGPAQPIHIYNGTLLWKIEGFQRKRQDAINGVKTALYSPHFYSSQFGYKMCAKIYMNGDGFGKGSHLSLFFVVMKGDYDALQTWPFQKKITMMLLDQGNGDHMIDAFHSDPQSSSFQRPRSDMNIASGSPLFMPLDSLSNRQYIKDDVMFIKIIVD